MRTSLRILLLILLLVAVASPCFAMMSIAAVSKQRARELGLDVRAKAAGSDIVRVELEFEIKGELKSFSRVELELRDGGTLLMGSTLREDRSKPGRVTVSFVADRSQLDLLTLMVVVQPAPRDMTGYELRVKEFVEPQQVR